VKVLWFHEGFERLSKSEQLAMVQRRVRKHYDKTGGKCSRFGEILQYRFADTFDTSVVLETNGDVVEEHSERFVLPRFGWRFSDETNFSGVPNGESCRKDPFQLSPLRIFMLAGWDPIQFLGRYFFRRPPG
jgi:hypothetical protein